MKLGISVASLNVYKHQFPELTESLRTGKEIADGKVEDSYFQIAKGFDYVETTRKFNAAGEEISREETTKKVLPNEKAAITWLKNRQKGKWRDNQEIDIAGKIVYKIEEAKKPKPEAAQ